MSYSEITLRLEYIIEHGKHEPYEFAREFSITEYVLDSESVVGTPILALQVNSDSDADIKTYHLHRDEEALPIDLADGDVQAILFKIRWHRFRQVNSGVTAAHVIFDGETKGPIDEDRDDVIWKYILVENEGQYHLVRKIKKGPGIVLPCQVLKDNGVDCSNPKNEIERRDCHVYNCVNRPERPWWSRLFTGQ